MSEAMDQVAPNDFILTVVLMGYTVIVIVFMMLVLPHWKPETILLINCNTRTQESTPLGSSVIEINNNPAGVPQLRQHTKLPGQMT